MLCPAPSCSFTICWSSNLAGINFYLLRSLRSQLSPTQTSDLILSPCLPLQQEVPRASSLCCPGKEELTMFAHPCHPSLARWVYSMVNLESEIPVKQFMHFGWCIVKNVFYCFRTEVPCSSLSAKHHFGGSSTPMGKWREKMKKGHIRCPIPWKVFYRSQILTWSYTGSRSAIEV